MKLISDIINELIDSEKSVTSPLLKTKVLASRLKNEELLTWVNNELNGYDFNATVPEYRKCDGNVSGTYLSGNWQFNDQPLPTTGLPHELEQVIRQMDFYQSVATLESLQSNNKSGTLEAVFPAELSALMERNIQKMGNPFFQIIRARRYTSINVVTQILSVIRSKLLDFMLKLDEEFGNLTEIEEMKNKNEQISTIMNQTIINTGDGNVVNTGDNSKVKANISINKGDKAALKQKLSQNGIAPEDVDELINIIDTELPDNTTGVFGQPVQKWTQKMLGKAVDGSWQIGLGAAGNLLTELLKAYYGI
jgi:hypothetical protein